MRIRHFQVLAVVLLAGCVPPPPPMSYSEQMGFKCYKLGIMPSDPEFKTCKMQMGVADTQTKAEGRLLDCQRAKAIAAQNTGGGFGQGMANSQNIYNACN